MPESSGMPARGREGRRGEWGGRARVEPAACEHLGGKGPRLFLLVHAREALADDGHLLLERRRARRHQLEREGANLLELLGRQAVERVGEILKDLSGEDERHLLMQQVLDQRLHTQQRTLATRRVGVRAEALARTLSCGTSIFERYSARSALYRSIFVFWSAMPASCSIAAAALIAPRARIAGARGAVLSRENSTHGEVASSRHRARARAAPDRSARASTP